jgi:hypothetical protein
MQNISDETYSTLIVQPEQLFMNNGHMPRLARLVSQNYKFNQLIKLLKRLHVDEYDLPAFRSAWGRLGELRIKLGNDITVQSLSGTEPEHIKKAIIKCLPVLFDESNLCSIKLTSNRLGPTHATHQIVNELSDFRNLDFLITSPYPAGFQCAGEMAK